MDNKIDKHQCYKLRTWCIMKKMFEQKGLAILLLVAIYTHETITNKTKVVELVVNEISSN